MEKPVRHFGTCSCLREIALVIWTAINFYVLAHNVRLFWGFVKNLSIFAEGFPLAPVSSQGQDLFFLEGRAFR